MKLKTALFLLLLLPAFLLSSCTGQVLTTSSWAGITVDGDVAYLAYNQHLYVVNLADGIEAQKYPEKANGRNFFAAPSLTPDGQLIVGDYTHTLYSLDAQSLAEKWKFDQADKRYIANSLVTEDTIFAPSADGQLYALDLAGRPLWPAPFKIEGEFWSQPVSDPQCGCIYISSMNHFLYAVNAESGTLLWKQDLEASVVSAPTYSADGKLYIGSFASKLFTLDAKSGEILNTFPTEGWVWGSPTLVDERLYFGDLKGNLYVLNTQDGTQVNKFTADGGITGAPLVMEDKLYFTTEVGSLYALDLDGKPVWNQPSNTGGKLYGTPVPAGDLILVAQVGTKTPLLAYDASGVQKWAFTPK